MKILSIISINESLSSLFLIGFFISNIISLTIGYYTETILTKNVKEKLKMRFA